MIFNRSNLLVVLCIGWLILTAGGVDASSQAGAFGTTVVLDPGHGGRDRGTYWGGVAEKMLTLNIARKVEVQLRARGIRTAMTRRSDVYRSLGARAAIANGFNRSILVSIHCNADPMHRASGIETFYYGSGGWNLARSIHRRLDRKTTANDRGVKFGSYAVLRHTGCPAALVECGFLTAPRERRLLTTPLYQDVIARAIADGIVASIR